MTIIHPDQNFGPFRSIFWPIRRNEVKKIIPMMIMLFLICLSYSILRNVKDAVVVTAKSSGAEVIPFIKVWVLLPMAILATCIFTKLTNRFSQEKVFYIIISFFLLFFMAFVYLFFPYHEWFHSHNLTDQLAHVLPPGFKGLIAMFRNWSFTIFYVMCELWGSMILSVLFWGFANEITAITEARRFYSMLGLVASFSSVSAGCFANYLTTNNWEETFRILMNLIILSGLAIMCTMWWMNRHVLRGKKYEEFHHTVKFPKKKISMRESFYYLSNSKYLICIAIMVICYNLVINLVEIIWKDQLRQLCPSPVDYNRYMNNVTSCVGIIATVTSLCISQFVARFGWTKTALITPVLMMITGIGFFAFLLFRQDLSDVVMTLVGTTPLAIAVFFGAAQVCISKACKYSLFDSTKEMTFIPLGHECKLKGKAAIDGVGSRLGKSGGSVVHQSLLLFFGSFAMSAPYVAAILMLVIGGWIFAVRSLGKQFAVQVGQKDYHEIEETQKTSNNFTAADVRS